MRIAVVRLNFEFAIMLRLELGTDVLGNYCVCNIKIDNIKPQIAMSSVPIVTLFLFILFRTT